MTRVQRLFRVTDFERVLCHEPLPLLVGGQAVNLWAMVYTRGSEILARLEPFLSCDCDLYGDVETLLRLGQATDWEVTFSPKGSPSPVVGFLTRRDAPGRELTVEVLHTVRGLQHKDLARETTVRLDANLYRTLSPVTLLKAKLANFIEIPQQAHGQTRNDLKHLRILVPCVAGYLAEAHERAARGALTERGLVNLLEETLSLVSSDYARRIGQSEHVDFLQCFPTQLENSPLPKVQSLCHHRLAGLRSTGWT